MSRPTPTIRSAALGHHNINSAKQQQLSWSLIADLQINFPYENATEEQLAQLAAHCHRSNPNRDIIHELLGGHSVIRMSNDVVVKRGFGVLQEELLNQMCAYELIDQTIIRVPQVHRFFEIDNIGYIIDYIDGEPLNLVEDTDTYDAISKILAYLAQIRSDQSGPLGGGRAMGNLWLFGNWIAPTSSSEIEEYYNLRQLRLHEKLEINTQDFSTCCFDLASRNILKQRDGSLTLIDWSSAGFYPRFFEICALRINIRKQKDLNSQLLRLIEALDEHDEQQAELLEKAYYLSERYN
ncbi:Protein kinase domain containing protein [Pyrenophora tritici-repentis]|nr:Protein kinase domain containing protein [Pyrenophora tritici-repentis]